MKSRGGADQELLYRQAMHLAAQMPLKEEEQERVFEFMKKLLRRESCAPEREDIKPDKKLRVV